MGRYDDIITGLATWASTEADVRLVLLVGSQARVDSPADQWSDLDVVLVSRRPEPLVQDAAWPLRFGRTVCSFTEGEGAWTERRVLYGDNRDVDFVFLRLDVLVGSPANPQVASMLARGCRVLLDKDGLAGTVARMRPPVAAPALPGARELENDVNDFLYHTVWAAKKLGRGELWTALGCLNGYLGHLLLRMLRWHSQAAHEQPMDTWHDGRFLERWVPAEVQGRIGACFAHYDTEGVPAALRAMRALYVELATTVARKVGWRVPAEMEREAGRLLEETISG